MKCKIVSEKDVMYHGQILKRNQYYDFAADDARTLTEKGFIKPIKLAIQELEAVLDDESIPKVLVPVMATKHPSEEADIEAMVEKTEAAKPKTIVAEEVEEDELEAEDNEILEMEDLVDEPAPKKKPATKKKAKKRG